MGISKSGDEEELRLNMGQMSSRAREEMGELLLVIGRSEEKVGVTAL